jgi:uncharacterized repeat protein (TIGR01451 family)
MALTAGGLIAALLPTGFAWAECIKSSNDPSLFSLLVDASSSCAALSSNMTGCQVNAATGKCTMTKGAESITVELTAGSVGGTTPISWRVSNSTTANPKAGTVDFSIEVGATGGGTCGWSYSPGSTFGAGTAFLKSNGSIQKINDIYFCSDFLAPPADVPRLSLTKTVMAKGGTCGVNDVDLLDAKTGDEVEYCYVVENLGNGNADNLVFHDDLGTPDNMSDDLTLADIINLTGLDGGVLVAGGKATGKSPAVMLSAAGKLVNTATVDGESVDYPPPQYNVPPASDTATVNVEQSLVTCPADFQKAVNQLVTQTDDFTYAVLNNPKKPEDVSVCVPTNEDPDYVRVRGVSCIDDCVLKTGCDQTPLPAGCAPQVCQSSGYWTTHDESTGACIKVTDTGGQMPYCWEVEQDLNQDCVLNATQPMKIHEVTNKQIHSNPYVYQSCVKSGGRKVCTTYCYLYPGEDASVCPSTSIIQ